jgi:predicted permease
MALWRSVSRGLRVLTRRSRADADLDDELRHFLDEAAALHEARGLSRAEAGRAARREIGDALLVRERVRDAGWEHAVETMLADVRLAGRWLRKTPIFSAVVVLVVALGAGAATTVFSAMNAIVLRPPPGIIDAGRLVSVLPSSRTGASVEQGSHPLYLHLRERSRTLDGLASWGRVSLTIAADGPGVQVYGNMVSGNYFDVLGVRPALGRFFAPEEDRVPGAHPVLVVSHAFWRSSLGGSPAAPGRTVFVSGVPFTLIGITPPGFHGIYTGLRADAWVPLAMQPQLRPRASLAHGSWTWMFGRLRDGVHAAGAERELSQLSAARAREAGLSDTPDALTAARVVPLTGLPGGEGGPVLGFMSLLLAAAGLVLLIAGVNVAALCSAQYLARRREMAVRSALGAGRGRLLRQLITEILLLFAAGALGGFVVAAAATAALERLPLPETVPVSLELSPDLRVLAFAIAVSLAAGLVFGLAPALQAVRRDLTATLRDDSAGGGRRRPLVGRVLIVGQLALSLVLLVAAGLFLRALGEARGLDPGFARDGVATAQLEPEAWGYDEPRARAFYSALRARLEAVPGVHSVSFTRRLPLMMSRSTDRMRLDGAGEMAVDYNEVGAGYFDALQLPLLQGRAFGAADDERAPRVAIVNETLARIAWSGGAIGRTLRFRDEVVTVVGVARDARYASLDEPTPAFVYFPVAQVWHPTQALLLRTDGAPESMAAAVRRAVQAIDPRLPPPRVTTLRRVTDLVVLPQRAAAIVTGILGGAGLLLAAAGLYGAMAFAAGQRTREIGIRVALGADRSGIVRLMLREGLLLTAAGLAAGGVLAAGAGRLIAGWLYGVSPLDGATYLATSACLAAVALVAAWLPARRAASIDPLVALRAD